MAGVIFFKTIIFPHARSPPDEPQGIIYLHISTFMPAYALFSILVLLSKPEGQKRVNLIQEEDCWRNWRRGWAANALVQARPSCWGGGRAVWKHCRGVHKSAGHRVSNSIDRKVSSSI